MESSGRPTERWMTLVPLTVFVFIVVIALGGPDGFVRTVGELDERSVGVCRAMVQGTMSGLS